jgi:FMN phosphatase YigB (HAD superfamily)
LTRSPSHLYQRPPAKPSAAPFVAAAQRARLPLRRIVHVGDSLAKDVVGALDAGMCAVFLERGSSVDAEVCVLLCTVTFYANLAHSLTRSL